MALVIGIRKGDDILIAHKGETCKIHFRVVPEGNQQGAYRLVFDAPPGFVISRIDRRTREPIARGRLAGRGNSDR